MRALRKDPDDTASAIRVIAALSGNSGRRDFERFQRSIRGARILHERRDLFDVLTDQARLEAMPPGSLGRTIIEWFKRENISTQGLAQASEAARGDEVRVLGDLEQIYRKRLLNLHDVYHVVAGYDRDIYGEMAVLAFTLAQNYNRGIAYLTFNALRTEGWSSPAGKLIRQGYRRGKRAKRLVEEDWEKLFERQLDDVRRQLCVGDPPVYEQFRSPGAPALSA